MMGQSDFTDDTKFGRMAIGPDRHAIIQQKLDRLKKWADKNLGKFRKEQFKALYLVRSNSVHHYMLRVTQLKSNLSEKDLGVLMDTKMNMSK